MIWVHGFHLLLLPSFLSRVLRTARVGLFLHTPFPSSEIFRTLPFREDLLRGMLNADQVLTLVHVETNCGGSVMRVLAMFGGDLLIVTIVNGNHRTLRQRSRTRYRVLYRFTRDGGNDGRVLVVVSVWCGLEAAPRLLKV